jgi:hypothetical protein
MSSRELILSNLKGAWCRTCHWSDNLSPTSVNAICIKGTGFLSGSLEWVCTISFFRSGWVDGWVDRYYINYTIPKKKRGTFLGGICRPSPSSKDSNLSP